MILVMAIGKQQVLKLIFPQKLIGLLDLTAMTIFLFLNM